MTEDKWSKSPFPKTCSLLESYGINPYDVPADDSIYPDGYDTFVPYPDGVFVRGDAPRLRTFHEWPDGVDGALIYRTALEERGGGGTR